ncbi:MAG: nucleotide exchange factor GrpE [Candidatus Aenigmatarchaeota archaeon]
MPRKSKKLEELEKLLEEERKKSEMYLEQYKYLKADFENFRKISEREKEEIVKSANKKIIEDLLEILDDLDSAIGKINGKELEGLVLIRSKLLKILGNYGLKEIECVGKKFDPYYHEVMLTEKSEKEDGIILQELQKGYMLGNKVIRHSKVKISRGDVYGN